MSFQAMTWAVEQDLPVKEKMTLMMLANRTNHDTGRCDPSHKRLARDCGMSESSVKRAIAMLEELGLIEIESRKVGDVNLPNQYVLKLEPVGSHRPDLRSVGTQGVGSARPTNQETNNQEVKQKLTPTPAGQVTFEVPDWVPADAWESFVEMRKAMGAKGKLTDRAVKLLVNELEKLRGMGQDPGEVLKQSVMNNWRGVFPLKTNGRMQAPSRIAQNFQDKTYQGTSNDQFADAFQ